MNFSSDLCPPCIIILYVRFLEGCEKCSKPIIYLYYYILRFFTKLGQCCCYYFVVLYMLPLFPSDTNSESSVFVYNESYCGHTLLL